jgi:flagellar basal body-associated protein FliL
MRKLVKPIIIAVVSGFAALAAIGCNSEPAEPWVPETQEVEWSLGDKFTVNLKEPSSKYIIVNAVLVVQGTEEEPDTIDQVMTDLTDLLESKRAVIRDAVSTALGGVTEEDMLADDAQDNLKVLLTDTIHELLQIDNITEVLFDELMVG